MKLLKTITALTLAVLLVAGACLSAFAEDVAPEAAAAETVQPVEGEVPAEEDFDFEDDEFEIEIDDDDWGSIDEEYTAVCPDAISVDEIAPVEEAPTMEASVAETPVAEAPVEEAPVTEAPAEATPVEEVQVTETPVAEVTVEEAPVTEAPVEEAPVTEAPVEETPAEEAQATEAPVVEATVEEVPVADAPVEATPIEEAQATEAPAEETVVEPDPVEETSIEEAPVEEKVINYSISPKESKEYFFGDKIVLISKADGAMMNESVTWQSLDRNDPNADWKNIGNGPKFEITITREALAFAYRFVTADGAASGVYTISATEKPEAEIIPSEEVNDEDIIIEETSPEAEQNEAAIEDVTNENADMTSEELPEALEENTVAENSENEEMSSEETEVENETEKSEENPEITEEEIEQIDISNMKLVQVNAAKGEKMVKLYAEPDTNSGVAMNIASGTAVYLQQFDANWSLVVMNNTRYYTINSNIIVFGNDDNTITEEEQETFHTVSIHSELAGMSIVVSGTPITMTASLTGFEDEEYTVQWYYSTDGIERIAIPGATDLQYTYNINRENVGYYWYIVVTTPDEEEQEA